MNALHNRKIFKFVREVSGKDGRERERERERARIRERKRDRDR